MSDLDVILTRRSIRRYETRDIPQDVLENIFEVGRQSLSAVNKQPIRFIAVTDKELKKFFFDAL
ncbi:MAG: nitroreductase family protein, partial [Candidatus Bathyarchaeota archaeon]|nr:nitroreductase family protein [Candidatus Bathyarchaeota archaeon]